MHTVRRTALLRFTGAALLIAAFSFGGGIARADDPTFRLTIKDHKFDPEVIEVPAGVKIALIVKNADSTPEEFESNELRREKVIPGGQEATIYVGPLRPGSYEFFGEFNPKTARGRIVAK
ncbi:MAG: cupredoxin domain-containing protein [Gemmatimonas sp.]